MRGSWLGGVLGFLWWSLIFGISYSQATLYYSNQNQYFLHGLAAARGGDLTADWLAQTKDPTPVFSAIVAGTALVGPEWLFYIYYLLMLGLYCQCLVALFTLLAPQTPGPNTRRCFITLLVVVHAAVARMASARLLGVDYPWYFQAGVAGQYLLGFGLQPSVAGVFLLASIVAFLRERPWRAVAWLCLAGILHATYLPTGALLTLAYMVVRTRERGWHAALTLGGAALALVLPAVIYNLITFAPSDPGAFREAQHILAQIRIPHHAVVARWFDGIALAQILWVVAALILVRRSKLFLLLAIPFGGAVLGTLIQLATGSDTLALLFPWRTSAVLVPIATTIMLSRVALGCGPWLERLDGFPCLIVRTLFGFILLVCVAGGLAVPLFELGYRTNRDEVPTLEFVRATQQPGDVYLIPVDVPKAGPRGAASTNFMPAPRKGSGLIAIDLQGFRLATNAPLYVDFKSIPYKDEEVLEWYRRVLWCRDINADKGISVEDLRAALGKKGITHVLAPAADARPFDKLGIPLYTDRAYSIFQVVRK